MKAALSILLFFLESQGAHASLGQLEASVETDRKQLSVVVQGTSKLVSKGEVSFVVHEMKNKKMVVREYAANGSVFAISWTGKHHPDLSVLLGSYFEDYQKSSQMARKARGGRSYGRVEGQNVVVEKSGHMRWIQGKAYLPASMPEGVSANDIQ